MGDGWETSRSRGKDHVDWAIIKLGAPGTIQRLLVDTAFFRGNFPQKVKVEAIHWTEGGEPGALAGGWTDLVEPIKCGPDREHEIESLVQDKTFTHVKLVMIPDGGVKRIRVFGKRSV
jgi:allantoicase